MTRYKDPIPTAADRAEARRVLEAGYHQVSLKYRTVSRLPAGQTGRQALAASKWTTEYDDPKMQEEQRRRAFRMDESTAADQFLRVYATDVITLTPAVWLAFKQLGGGPVR